MAEIPETTFLHCNECLKHNVKEDFTIIAVNDKLLVISCKGHYPPLHVCSFKIYPGDIKRVKESQNVRLNA